MDYSKYLRSLIHEACKASVVGAALLAPLSAVQAAPVISQVIKADASGVNYRIVGSGFGVKSKVQPFKFDSFENGTPGALITTNGWTAYNPGIGAPAYSANKAHTGGKSALRQTPYERDDFASAGLKGLQSDEIYYSVWFFWEKVSGNYDKGTPIVKIARINSTPSFYSGSTSSPSFWITQQPSNGWTYAGMTNNSGSFTDQQNVTGISSGTWHRIEVSIKLSNPAGSNNGLAKVWIDGVPSYSHKTGITRTSSEAGRLLDNFLLPAMIDRGGQVMAYYADDVYVDNTRARVEVCTSATWSNCKIRDVQVASSWTDGAISFSLRKDAFPSGQSLYAYVVDKDGNVNANGYPLAVVSVAPAAPTSLSVQ